MSGTTRHGLARLALALGVVAATTLVSPSALAQARPIEVTLDSAEIGSQPGTVVLSGTVTCDIPVEAAVFGDVAQVQGLDIARDFFGLPVECSSTPSNWTATSFGAQRVFLPLPTTIDVNAQYCVGELCHTASISQTLTLPPPATRPTAARTLTATPPGTPTTRSAGRMLGVT